MQNVCKRFDTERSPCVISDIVKGTQLKLSTTLKELIKAQSSEPELIELYGKSLSVEEADTVPVCHFAQYSAFAGKYRPPEIPNSDEWSVLKQTVLPSKYSSEIPELTKALLTSGHLGKTKKKR